jgi:pimeloyl-ACP methyl ester carboxylesterase
MPTGSVGPVTIDLVTHEAGEEGGRLDQWRTLSPAEHRRTGRFAGVDLSYFELGGEGHPLLFLHGIGNSARLWLPYAAEIAHGYRCLVVDLPGFGGSRARAGDVGVDRVVEVLAEFLDNRGVAGSAVAVGHSMGALVVAHMAATAPDALRGAICVSGPPLAAIASYRNPLSALFRSPGETFALLFLVLVGALPFSEWLMSRAIRHRTLRRMVLGRFVDRFDLLDAETAAFMFGDFGNGRVLAAARNGFGYPYEDIYPRTGVRPHAVVGDGDPIMSATDGRRYLELAGGGTLHVVEQCAHLPMVERPDVLSRIIHGACE